MESSNRKRLTIRTKPEMRTMARVRSVLAAQRSISSDASRSERAAKPAADIAGIIKQCEQAGPLNSLKAEVQAGIGFDEVDEQAEGQVGDHEEFEGVAGDEARCVQRTPCGAGGGAAEPEVPRLRGIFASRRCRFTRDDKI